MTEFRNPPGLPEGWEPAAPLRQPQSVLPDRVAAEFEEVFAKYIGDPASLRLSATLTAAMPGNGGAGPKLSVVSNGRIVGAQG